MVSTKPAGLIITVVAMAMLASMGAWSQNNGTTPKQHIKQLRTEIQKVQDQTENKKSPAYRTNMPLARLQLKKAELAARQEWGYYVSAIEGFKQKGLNALDRIDNGQPVDAKAGQLTELAYITRNDGTTQPYYLYLPKGYTEGKNWPLIVFLHGYVPTTSVLDPWVLDEEVCRIAGRNGCMLLIPYGRRNTDFQGVGELDVLRTTDLVKQRYSVDNSRIYISGVSMGGMGAWNMALRHPGKYAAATPIAGQTDMHAWWPKGGLINWPKSRHDLTPFKRLLVEWDNPIDLVRNARNQHIFVQHGEDDNLIPAEQSTKMVDAASKRNISINYFEHSGAGHYIYWDTLCFKKAWRWQKRYSLGPPPRHITYKTYSLEYDTAHWLRIGDFQQWGEPATVDCEVTGGRRNLEIKSDNVRLLHIDTSTAPIRDPQQCTAMVNDRQVETTVTDDGVLVVRCEEEKVEDSQWPPRKRKGLCGPVEEVFDDPFIVVGGTAGDDTQDKRIARKGSKWMNEWNQFADGVPRHKGDKQITESDIKRYNLVLFGTPQTNSVLKKMADRLPITIGDHKYVVGEQTFQGDRIGLVMCYPNPLAPDNYVAIYSGELYGRKCDINHKFDLIPDFTVFHGDKFTYDKTNKHIAAGYFNMNWQLDENLTWREKTPKAEEENE